MSTQLLIWLIYEIIKKPSRDRVNEETKATCRDKASK